jgi:hypothetical protein
LKKVENENISDRLNPNNTKTLSQTYTYSQTEMFWGILFQVCLMAAGVAIVAKFKNSSNFLADLPNSFIFLFFIGLACTLICFAEQTALQSIDAVLLLFYLILGGILFAGVSLMMGI